MTWICPSLSSNLVWGQMLFWLPWQIAFCQKLDKRRAPLLVLLDLSVAFTTIGHGILLSYPANKGLGGPLSCTGSSSAWLDGPRR